MAVETETLLVAVGVIVVGAYFASLLFRAIRIPDIVLLILLGVLMGPVFHFVEIELFETLASFIGTVALIVILFEGGLKIQRGELAKGVASGALLALLVFTATALLSALVGVGLLGLDAEPALLLGMSLGGAGAVIVIPLIQQLDVGQRAQTIVSIEAAVSDVLVVLGVVGLSTAIVLQQSEPADFAVLLVQNFSIGIFLGGSAGLLWVGGLKAFHQRSYEYVLTIAILFLLYVGTEFVEGSGPLAVLIFGLVVGNSRKLLKSEEKKRRNLEWAPVFGGELVSLHHEVIFFIRAFFFVTLGVILDLSLFADPGFLLGGALLSVAVVLGRFWGVGWVLGGARMTPWDRLVVSLMFPLGLAAAVVSLIPHQRFDIPGTETFGDYAAVAVVITNLLSAGLVFVLANPARRARLLSPKMMPTTPGKGKPKTEGPAWQR